MFLLPEPSSIVTRSHANSLSAVVDLYLFFGDDEL
jgi:hypothetical protein